MDRLATSRVGVVVAVVQIFFPYLVDFIHIFNVERGRERELKLKGRRRYA